MSIDSYSRISPLLNIEENHLILKKNSSLNQRQKQERGRLKHQGIMLLKIRILYKIKLYQ